MEEDERRMLGQFSQLRVFAIPPIPASLTNRKSTQKPNRMEGLAQDLNSALEESTRSSTTSSASSKRRFLRRRCKSTCNLSSMSGVGAGNSGAAGNSQHTSDDSSTSSLEDNIGLGVSSRGERGTSSLHLSDSDENTAMSMGSLASRKKRSESWNSTRISHANAESDSVNENVSPVRPNTKRKRKFKRMAIDPAAGPVGPSTISTTRSPTVRMSETAPTTPSGTIKRKKGRSKSATLESPLIHTSSSLQPPNQMCPPIRQRQASGVVPGKRKRSTREKSVETDLNQKGSTFIVGHDSKTLSMDCDDERRSSSSLSSTEWEDQDSGDEDNLSLPLCVDDGEADDEQSDWHDSSAGPVFLLTDDEDSSDMPMALFASEGANNEMQIENFNKLTSTARQAYLARMKRLAECVPGREIRAGTRRIRNRQLGFTIKSSSSEQLSRFLQDSSRTHLRLSVLRGSDRSKIVHLANLYSLSLHYEEPHLLVLSKTGKTVKVDEFLVPKTPSAKIPIEVKRRRRTPPPELPDHACDHDRHEGMEEELGDEFDISSKDDASEKAGLESEGHEESGGNSILDVAFEACCST